MDIFFNPTYGKIYEKVERGTCHVFEYSGKMGRIQNTFIKRAVPWQIDGKQYYDIMTPYGYGGPLIIDADRPEALMTEYAKAWKEYCKAHNIIAEFTRFHLFENRDVLQYFYGETVAIANHIVVDTSKTMNELWNDFHSKVRRNVRKACNNGLYVKMNADGENLDDFLEIYYSTMKRNNAVDYYYFDRSFFETLNATLKGNYSYFFALKDDKAISTELVLHSEKYAYFFLGGTNAEYYGLRPNDYLKHEIISWCVARGLKYYILSGGYRENDGVYKYKKAFAPNGDVPFYVGNTIHDKKIYDALVEKRRKSGTFDETSVWFPLYRQNER